LQQVNHLDVIITNNQVNSAFYPSWTGKSTTNLFGWS